MKILREKIFGAIKRANKAAKRQHEINEYLRDHGDKVTSPRHNLSKLDERLAKLNEKLDKDLEELGARSKRDNSIEAKALHRSRLDKKYDLFGPKDKLAEKQKDLEELGQKKFMQSRKENAAFAREQNEIQERIYELDNLIGGSGKEKKPFVSWEKRNKAEKEAARQKEQAAKKAAEDKARREAEKVAAQERLQAKKERISASKASVEKHKGKADEIRDNNKLGVAIRDAKRWVKKNPGKSAAIGAGVAAVGAGLGYAAYKLRKNKKNKEK